MKKAIIALIATVLILLCVILIANADRNSQDPVVIFDRIGERIPSKDQLEIIGLSRWDKNEIVLNEEFVAKYLEKHTKEELLEKTVKLYERMRTEYTASGEFIDIRDGEWHSSSATTCRCQGLTTLLNLALQANGIERFCVTADMAGKPGYYTENPDARPQPFEETVYGEFYQRDGTDVHTETRTSTGTVRYYGDYAILTVDQWWYNKGEYGWKGGIFFDELPSWGRENYSELYYKGKLIQEAQSAQELLSGTAGIGTIDINGTPYEVSQVSATARGFGWESTHTFMDVCKTSE